MGSGTKIAWATDTWNPWIGCTKVATECSNCYAAELDRTRFSKALGEATKAQPIVHWGAGAPRYSASEASANAPFRWNKKPLMCQECGATSQDTTTPHANAKNPTWWCEGEMERRRVFTGSLMDWADEEVSDQTRHEMFNIAEACTNLLFLFLTKRGQNMHRFIESRYGQSIPRHFWFGLSWMHERQEEIEWFLRTPAKVRFISVEPMLGPVDLTSVGPNSRSESGRRGGGCNGKFVCNALTGEVPYYRESDGEPCIHYGNSIDWVIFGGESGPNARPCNVRWIRDGVRQCRDAGVKVFVKQLGSKPLGIERLHPDCKSDFAGNVLIRDSKGADPIEWPTDLRVQEIPIL